MAKSFYQAFKLDSAQRGNCVSLFGSGGKTSLLFLLAEEGAAAGNRVLVSTTTKMWVPQQDQYSVLDLSGKPQYQSPSDGTVTVVGKLLGESGKMTGPGEESLRKLHPFYNLILLETDGSAEKPLKGWRDDEPVIPSFTTHSIGVMDITQLDRPLSSDNVHRCKLFYQLTGATSGAKLTLEQFSRIITARNGLLKNSYGRQFVFLNKVESQKSLDQVHLLRKMLPELQILAGSVLQKRLITYNKM